MMLRYSFGLAREAEAVVAAVCSVLEEGYRTPDLVLAGRDDAAIKVTDTVTMGDLVAERIAAQA